jgi:hypothetical protein
MSDDNRRLARFCSVVLWIVALGLVGRGAVLALREAWTQGQAYRGNIADWLLMVAGLWLLMFLIARAVGAWRRARP